MFSSGKVAQDFPVSAKVIYDTLVADTVFMSYIGEYVFKTGDTLPAISVVTPGSDLPSVKTVEGIEIVIHDTATLTRREYLTSSADIDAEWSLFAICWKPATGADMTQAIMRILQIFAGSYSYETVATPDGLGAMVQTAVRIPSYMPILT